MSRFPPLLAAAMLAVLVVARAAPGVPRVPTDEEKLLARLHELDERQMQLGRLAQQRGESRLTRRLGARLERDHDETDARLLRRAEKRGATVEERGPAPEDRQRVQRLLSLDGRDFDRAYAAAVSEDSERAAALLRAERSMTQDRAARRELGAMLSLAREHRRLADFVQRRT